VGYLCATLFRRRRRILLSHSITNEITKNTTPWQVVLDLGPMYATDRQTSDAHHRLMPPTLGVGHNNGGGDDDDSNNNNKNRKNNDTCIYNDHIISELTT